MKLKSVDTIKKYVRKGKDYAKQLGFDVKDTALDMLPESAKEAAVKAGSALKSDYKEIKKAVTESKAMKKAVKAKDTIKGRYTKDGKINKGRIAGDSAIAAGVVAAGAGAKSLASDKSESHEDRITRKLKEGKPLTEAERKYKKLYMD